ncbi:hypothetical protein [Lignipirellula cremea]|nr:hypothetical protein [Lignipirellula cremea]
MTKPLQALTGGIPGIVPPTAAELAAGGPVGVAAKIKAEQINAKARQAAVKELGLVDCHYFPEAEAMLIAALRADTSDCVRFEAAKSLSNGCCCSKAVVAALNISVSGSEEDGHPSERSPMVRSAAICALNVCMTSCGGEEPVSPSSVLPRPEFPLPSPDAQLESIPAPEPQIQKTAYYQAVDRQPFHLVAARSRRLLAQYQPTLPPGALANEASPVQRPRSLYELWAEAAPQPSAAPVARTNVPGQQSPVQRTGPATPRPLAPAPAPR